MNSDEKKYPRFEKLFEIAALVVVVSIFLIIQLPLEPSPNRTIIYLTIICTSVLVMVMRWLKIGISDISKDFIESILIASAIAVIVHFSGGIRSYFIFLYLFPTLRISATSTIWHTLIMWVFTSGLILGEVLFFAQAKVETNLEFISSPISLAALFGWSIGVISGYGRYLASQLQKAKSAATLTDLEKEKSVNNLKDEFLFIISHELRGPVTAIRGYLELFITGSKNLNQQVKNYAKIAFNEGDKLADLIAELLDISRIEVNKLKLQNEEFEINDQLEEVTNKYANEAQEKSLTLSKKPKEKNISIVADKDRFKLITKNLLENALKYTNAGGKIWVWAEEKNNQAAVSVADSGVGVSEAELPHIFDRFHGSNDQKDTGELKEKSIGLGLFLAKNLTEKMGGRISVSSVKGEGSTFTFTLPVKASK